MSFYVVLNFLFLSCIRFDRCWVCGSGGGGGDDDNEDDGGGGSSGGDGGGGGNSERESITSSVKQN